MPNFLRSILDRASRAHFPKLDTPSVSSILKRSKAPAAPPPPPPDPTLHALPQKKKTAATAHRADKAAPQGPAVFAQPQARARSADGMGAHAAAAPRRQPMPADLERPPLPPKTGPRDASGLRPHGAAATRREPMPSDLERLPLPPKTMPRPVALAGARPQTAAAAKREKLAQDLERPPLPPKTMPRPVAPDVPRPQTAAALKRDTLARPLEKPPVPPRPRPEPMPQPAAPEEVQSQTTAALKREKLAQDLERPPLPPKSRPEALVSRSAPLAPSEPERMQYMAMSDQHKAVFDADPVASATAKKIVAPSMPTAAHRAAPLPRPPKNGSDAASVARPVARRPAPPPPLRPGEIPVQRLYYGKNHLAGTMAAYPGRRAELGGLFRQALTLGQPRITNLADPRDLGKVQSQVDRLPERRKTFAGGVWLYKMSVPPKTQNANVAGSDGHGGVVSVKRSIVLVFDPAAKPPRWQPVEHNEVANWREEHALPAQTFDRLTAMLHRDGKFDQGLLLSGGERNHLPALMFRSLFQSYMRERNAMGYRVSNEEAKDFVRSLLTDSRNTTGQALLSDPDQMRTLLNSCRRAVVKQSTALTPSEFMPG